MLIIKIILTVVFIILMERRLWTNQVSNPNMKEDEIIVSLVNEHGPKRWTLIAEEMKKIQPSHRTSKQIR